MSEECQCFKSTKEILEHLESIGYRFTVKLPERTFFNEGIVDKLSHALVVDTETTGAEDHDKLIELGMVLVEYDRNTGLFYRVLDTFNELEDPGMPISPEATKVNGITDEMVAGKKFDDAKVIDMLSKAQLVIAHNAKFDRKYLEARFPQFADKYFSCSHKEIPWAEEGMGSTKLDYIMYKAGYHYEAHRALTDCYALMEALQITLKESNIPAMLAMIRKSRIKDYDIAALNTPFETKDLLKARKYYWDGDAKVWHKEIPEDEVEAELAWLKETVYGNRAFSYSRKEITALNRFSGRENPAEVIRVN